MTNCIGSGMVTPDGRACPVCRHPFPTDPFRCLYTGARVPQHPTQRTTNDG